MKQHKKYYRCFAHDSTNTLWRWWSSLDPYDVFLVVPTADAQTYKYRADQAGIPVYGDVSDDGADDEETECLLPERGK